MCDFFILAFWLEIAYSCPFSGRFGAYSPNDVTHHSNLLKGTSWETGRLSHKN